VPRLRPLRHSLAPNFACPRILLPTSQPRLALRHQAPEAALSGVFRRGATLCSMASYTRPPKSYPQSLRYKAKEEPSPLVKARTHDRKADKIKDDDEGRLHLEYLERYKALEQ